MEKANFNSGTAANNLKKSIKSIKYDDTDKARCNVKKQNERII